MPRTSFCFSGSRSPATERFPQKNHQTARPEDTAKSISRFRCRPSSRQSAPWQYQAQARQAPDGSTRVAEFKVLRLYHEEPACFKHRNLYMPKAAATVNATPAQKGMNPPQGPARDVHKHAQGRTLPANSIAKMAVRQTRPASGALKRLHQAAQHRRTKPKK